jgi:hypothetical protein
LGDLSRMSSEANLKASVSIVLPTYNRSGFLKTAFESVDQQRFRDWELIVVDDGSTDDTHSIVAGFAASCERPVRYIRQENRGPAAARNVGVDHSSARYIAFYDSDDLWLPGYLERSVGALQANPDLDWVFSSCKIVDLGTGEVVASNVFYIGETPRPLMNLRVEHRDGGLNVIVDRRVLACQIMHGLLCGPQNSVMKRELLERRKFPEQLRIGEDQLFAICALADRRRLGYFVEPQVIYHVHAGNSSLAGTSGSAQRSIDGLRPLVSALALISSEFQLTNAERRALNRRLGREYFWHLGYSGYWQAGRRLEALEMFKRGLAAWPWNAVAWKTYLLARLKVVVRGAAS